MNWIRFVRWGRTSKMCSGMCPLFEGTAICSAVWNNSGCLSCTTIMSVKWCTLSGKGKPIMHCEGCAEWIPEWGQHCFLPNTMKPCSRTRLSLLLWCWPCIVVPNNVRMLRQQTSNCAAHIHMLWTAVCFSNRFSVWVEKCQMVKENAWWNEDETISLLP